MIRNFDIMLEEQAVKNSTDQALLALETFYILNYFNRHIVKYKFSFEKVTTLNIILGGSKNTLIYNTEWPETSRVLGCILTNTYDDFIDLNGINRVEHILSIIKTSASLYEKKINGIYQCVTEILDSFRKDNYSNYWYVQKKRVKGVGSISLKCTVSMTKFQLFLIMTKKNKDICIIKILETRPDSVFYGYLFKDVLIENSIVSINEPLSKKNIFIISINDLSKCHHGDFKKIHPTNPDYVYDENKKCFIYKNDKVEKNSKWWTDFIMKYDTSLRK